MNTVKSPEPVDLTMNEIGNVRGGTTLGPHLMYPIFSSKDYASYQLESSDKFDSLVEESSVTNGLSSSKNNIIVSGRPIAEGDPSLATSGISEVSNASSNQFSSSPNILSKEAAPTNLHDQPDFVVFFQEGYCKASELDESHELTGFVTDADSSSSHCDREKPLEDGGDNDDMLGGIFAFCEEGKSQELCT